MDQSLLLKTLEEALEETRAIPLWGMPPSFPWEAFSTALADTLQQKKFKLSHHKTEWLGKKDLISGMGDNPLIQPFNLSPLPGTFFWVMPKLEQKELLTLLLTHDHTTKAPSDPSLEEGFLQYIFLNVLETFNQINPYGNLVAVLDDKTSFEEGGFCIDVSILCNTKPLWGRIICPRNTLASFKSYFSMENPPLLSDKSFASMPLTLAIHIGSTELAFEEWKNVKLGDFILLDRCTYDLKNRRGTATLALASTPLFDVRLKEGEVKILEYALIQEEKNMSKRQFPEDNFLPENSSEMEENAPLWSPEDEEKRETLLPSNKIPILLTVEVGRFQMPLEKVTQLKPGNVLDLGLGAEPTVHLTVSGKRIAKGELVRLGETLGVKILKIGE